MKDRVTKKEDRERETEEQHQLRKKKDRIRKRKTLATESVEKRKKRLEKMKNADAFIRAASMHPKPLCDLPLEKWVPRRGGKLRNQPRQFKLEQCGSETKRKLATSSKRGGKNNHTCGCLRDSSEKMLCTMKKKRSLQSSIQEIELFC